MPKSTTPKSKKQKATKRPKAKPANGEVAPKRLSGLDAAAIVLKQAGEPMRPADIFAKAKEHDLWNPPGKTPIATLAAALCTHAKLGKGRFIKSGRGLFALAPAP